MARGDYRKRIAAPVNLGRGAPPQRIVVAGEGGEGAPSFWGVVTAASVGASAYHGYRRNQSLGWALGWAFAGGLFPVVTPAIALAQGFGKRKK